MIEINNTEVVGWQAAIRGMRNPKNSWDKSDSFFCDGEDCSIVMNYELSETEDHLWKCDNGELGFCVGANDHDLMTKLSNAGNDHSKYLRMIVVYADITAPLYWWSEYDTYKVGTVANSCSKMHKLLHKPFEMSDFSFDKLTGYKNEVKQFRPEYDYENEYWIKTEGGYFVSDFGRVKTPKGRIISGSIHKDGYIFSTIKGKQHPVHRLVANAFCPVVIGANIVNHIDGNKMNNASWNLEWVTQSENIQHSHDNNLQPKGLNTYKGKFTEEQRNEIKALWDAGKLSKRKIAEMYGVSHTCINDIINDKYKYVDKVNLYEEVARPLVDTLNELRDSWFTCEDIEIKKQIWYSILQLLPESYNQKRTVMLNYQVLKNMYHSRKNHKLDEWHTFCEWIESLPYSELITG